MCPAPIAGIGGKLLGFPDRASMRIPPSQPSIAIPYRPGMGNGLVSQLGMARLGNFLKTGSCIDAIDCRWLDSRLSSMALAIDRLPGQAVDSRSMGFDASTAVSMCMCPCACVLADLAYTALPHPCLAIKESTKGADVDASKSMATGSMLVDCLG